MEASDDGGTFDKIVAVATGMFFKDGMDKTPIQKIIDGVGIAKGTFYHHFKSKEDLVEKVLERLTSKILVETDRVMVQAGLSGRERLMLLFKQSGMVKTENMKESLVILRHMMEHVNQDFLRVMEESSASLVVPLFARILREGMNDGSLVIEYPEELAAMVVSLFMGFRNDAARLTLAGLDGDDEAIERLRRMFRAAETSLERMLGVGPGDLPIYGVDEFLQKLMEVRNDRS